MFYKYRLKSTLKSEVHMASVSASAGYVAPVVTETFDTLQLEATNAYSKFADHSRAAENAQRKIAVWQAFEVPETVEAAESLLNGEKDGTGNLDQYIAFRNTRDALPKMRAIFERVIKTIEGARPHPSVVEEGIEFCAFSGVDTSSVVATLNDKYVSKLSQLNTQLERIHKLYEEMTTHCTALRIALEPIAAKANDTITGLFYSVLKQTPNVNTRVQQRIPEMEATEAPE